MTRLLRITALALCLLTTGCAAQAVHTPTPTQTPFPCPFSNATPNSGAAPTALEVVRLYAAVQGLPEFRKCVQDAAGVQQFYVSALALPPVANNRSTCPRVDGATYYLTFLSGSNVVRMMTLDSSNCRYLYLSDMDIRLTNDAFHQQFATLVGLPLFLARTSPSDSPSEFGAT